MLESSQFEYLNLLASASTVPFKITLETGYGLIIELHPDARINAILNGSVVSTAFKEKQIKLHREASNSTASGYKCRVFPSWGSSHLFYDSSWPFNPPDMLNCEDEEILQDHKDKINEAALERWLEAFNAWGKRYDDAFDTELNATGDLSREDFPEIEARRVWTLEGMMLAVCLALLPGVDGVEYSPHSKKVVFSASGHGERSLSDIVQSSLKELNTHLTGG